MTSDDRSVHRTLPDADPARRANPADAADAAEAADAVDPVLRQALRALPPPGDPDRLAALQVRVLGDWRDASGRRRPMSQPAPAWAWAWRRGGAGSRTQAPGRRGRPAWALASVVLLGMAFAVAGLWPRLHGPANDQVLEELLQPDVLSQMAAGEM